MHQNRMRKRANCPRQEIKSNGDLHHNNKLPLDDDSNSSSNKEIILNVGGVRHFTTIQTLTSYESMLKARSSSRLDLIS